MFRSFDSSRIIDRWKKHSGDESFLVPYDYGVGIPREIAVTSVDESGRGFEHGGFYASLVRTCA